jgi:hypothetical protein
MKACAFYLRKNQTIFLRGANNSSLGFFFFFFFVSYYRLSCTNWDEFSNLGHDDIIYIFSEVWASSRTLQP